MLPTRLTRARTGTAVAAPRIINTIRPAGQKNYKRKKKEFKK